MSHPAHDYIYIFQLFKYYDVCVWQYNAQGNTKAKFYNEKNMREFNQEKNDLESWNIHVIPYIYVLDTKWRSNSLPRSTWSPNLAC